MNDTITVGRILRATAANCVVGCQIDQEVMPVLGDMIQITDTQAESIFGLITDIHVADDGLVRQLITSNNIPQSVIQDNRLNRNVPLEFSVCFIGYTHEQTITHLLPPRPPLSLDEMRLCSNEQIYAYLQAGNLGYFRHLLREQNPIVEEILTAHFLKAQAVMQDHQHAEWIEQAIAETIHLLRDDYNSLMKVLDALTDAGLAENLAGGGK